MPWQRIAQSCCISVSSGTLAAFKESLTNFIQDLQICHLATTGFRLAMLASLPRVEDAANRSLKFLFQFNLNIAFIYSLFEPASAHHSWLAQLFHFLILPSTWRGTMMSSSRGQVVNVCWNEKVLQTASKIISWHLGGRFDTMKVRRLVVLNSSWIGKTLLSALLWGENTSTWKQMVRSSTKQ